MTTNMAPVVELSFSGFHFLLLLLVIINLSVCKEPYHFLCAMENFDYFNLTAVTWLVTLNQSHCLHLSNNTQPPSQCTVLMAFCHRLSQSSPCLNSSICQMSDDGDLNLGSYVEDPFHKWDSPSSSGGFQAIFPNGSSYTSSSGSSCEVHTSIHFQCDPGTKWSVNGSIQTEKKAPDPTSVIYDNQKCQMSLTFDYAGACKSYSPPVGEMSAGTVLIVIFFVSIIFYFVFGSLINKARGRTGSKVIPHAKFWGMLPVYIFDGCQFVLCCGRQPVTSTYESI